MNEPEIANLEIDLLLEAIHRRYGYDFRSYARASIERRLRHFLSNTSHREIAELIPRVLRDEDLAAGLIQNFSIAVTEMFRDPEVYAAVRRDVVPWLKTYPHVKVWHAGCATGEEAYSMAIVLVEEGLYDKTTIFGTDFNDAALKQARDGIYPAEKIKEFTRNYQKAGGKAPFAQYYHASYESAVMASSLKKRLTFANHNLVTDGVFGELHLIFCRNVLIYFDRDLQNRALRLFRDSLVRGGFLCLGNKEDLQFTEVAPDFEVVDRSARIYKKKGP